MFVSRTRKLFTIAALILVIPMFALTAMASQPDAANSSDADVERWGQAITAVVALNPGYELDEIALRDFARSELAGYKLPKRILAKDDLERAPNGKANYQVIRDYAEAALA